MSRVLGSGLRVGVEGRGWVLEGLHTADRRADTAFQRVRTESLLVEKTNL